MKKLIDIINENQDNNPRNLGSLDASPLPSRGFTPFRDALMRKHMEAGGIVNFLDIEATIVSAETFDKIEELNSQPAEPSPALVDLMTRKRKYVRDY
ncbi:hypothetical protein PHYNN_191 [Pantoea phage Phynn]|nr:hypothetical protein PHYNN_191 [Pantoea phage Phynn]